MSPSHPTEEELRDDLDLYQCLLNSLEDQSDCDDIKQEYMHRICKLRRKLDKMGSASSQPVQRSDAGRSADDEASWSFNNLPSATFNQSLPSRKRNRSHLDLGDSDSLRSGKSRRYSPNDSPALSAVDSIDSDYFKDLDSGDDLKPDLRNQKSYWKEQEAKQRQQEEDERFARQLQEEWSQEHLSAITQKPKWSSTPPNTQNHSQSFLQRTNGTLLKPSPQPASKPSSQPQIEPEPTTANSVSYPDVIRLGDDSDSNDDDELQVLDAGAWTRNLGRQQPPPRQMPPTFGQNVYGVPGSFPGALPGPSAYQPGVHAQYKSYGSAGGSSVYGASSQPSGSTGWHANMTTMERIKALGNAIIGGSSNPYDVDAHRPPLPNSYNSDWALADSKETQEELMKLLQNIRPDEEIAVDDTSPQPEGLKVRLMPHQIKGLAWMKMMEEGANKGGILADDMGLGKTIQTIALYLDRPPEEGKHMPTLIVAPVALLEQWKREFQKLVHRGYQPVIRTVHGQGSAKTWGEIANADIVLTTYGTLAAELKRELNWQDKLKINRNAVRGARDQCPVLSERSVFHRVVLDEAQAIKNKNTKTAMAACRIQATYRWCLSGTPMQNRVEEIFSLIKFCRIRPYNDAERFNRDIARPLKNRYESQTTRAMEKLQALLKAILLRRTKKSQIDGKPILQLPEKNTVEDRAIFDKDQHDFYRSIEENARIQFNRYLQNGRIGQNYSKALVLLLRLRQCCCSPQLVINSKDFITDSGVEGIDMVENAKHLPADAVKRLRDQEEVECPICIDVTENATIFNPCGHAICQDCFSRMVDTAFRADDREDQSVKCPHCRAVIDTKRITDHKSFLEVYGEPARGDDGDDDAASQASANDSESEEIENNSDGGEDLKDFIVPDEDVDSDDSDDDDDLDAKPKMRSKRAAKPASKKSKGKENSKRAKKPKKKKEFLNLADLRVEGLKSRAAKQKYLKQLAKIYQPCAKIDKLLALLQQIKDNDPTEKTIVFSSFTSFLDLIEVPLSRDQTLNNYTRYDGSMTAKDRNESVLRFTDDPNCKVILVSLKAGNSGLNLTVANHVVILDPFWNPFVEYQAADRCHRIGQLREVTVHRVLIGEEGVDYKDEGVGRKLDNEDNFTVEDRILRLQEKKKQLVESALDENASSSVGRLGVRELGYLFGVNAMPTQSGS